MRRCARRNGDHQRRSGRLVAGGMRKTRRTQSLLEQRRERCPRTLSIASLVSEVANEAHIWSIPFAASAERMHLHGLALQLDRCLSRFEEISEAEAAVIRGYAVGVAQAHGLRECEECSRFFGGPAYEGLCSVTCYEDANEQRAERANGRPSVRTRIGVDV